MNNTKITEQSRGDERRRKREKRGEDNRGTEQERGDETHTKHCAHRFRKPVEVELVDEMTNKEA